MVLFCWNKITAIDVNSRTSIYVVEISLAGLVILILSVFPIIWVIVMISGDIFPCGQNLFYIPYPLFRRDRLMVHLIYDGKNIS